MQEMQLLYNAYDDLYTELQSIISNNNVTNHSHYQYSHLWPFNGQQTSMHIPYTRKPPKDIKFFKSIQLMVLSRDFVR